MSALVGLRRDSNEHTTYKIPGSETAPPLSFCPDRPRDHTNGGEHCLVLQGQCETDTNIAGAADLSCSASSSDPNQGILCSIPYGCGEPRFPGCR